MAQISKNILDRINSAIRQQSQLIQWRNTYDVIKWFEKIKYKRRKTFIKFDIDAFYPNITKEILLKALDFGRKFITISSQDIDIIMHSCKTILYYDKSFWIKKNNSDLFDIPMGSFHGAEACELVGLFLLNNPL